MTRSVCRLHEETRKGAQHLSQRLMPTAGGVPRIPGIDMHGVTAPPNVTGGDQDGNAQTICEAIVGDRQATTAQTDDLTLAVIKYR